MPGSYISIGKFTATDKKSAQYRRLADNQTQIQYCHLRSNMKDGIAIFPSQKCTLNANPELETKTKNAIKILICFLKIIAQR